MIELKQKSKKKRDKERSIKKIFLISSLLLIISALFFSFNSSAQTFHIKGTVKETFSQIPLAFVHIEINQNEKHYFTDIDGNFEIRSDKPIKNIFFSHYLHRTALIDTLRTDSLSLTINLNRHELFRFANFSEEGAARIIDKVNSFKNFNKIENLRSYFYSTYSKFTFSTSKNEKANKLMNEISRSLPFKFKTLMEDQHFFIVETVTEKKYRDKLHHKEIISGAKSSGINVPSLFIQGSQLQGFSLYEDYISLGGKIYISPLAKKTHSRYAFTLLDSAYTDRDTIFIIKFNPHPKKTFDALKGLLYINTKNYAVQYFIASPADEAGSVETSIVQSYKLHSEGIWFPERIKTIVSSFKGGARDIKFIATGNTYVSEVSFNNGYKKRNFDEIILEYPKEASLKDSSFWREHRKIPLTKSDSNTYAYFHSYDQKKQIEKFLQLGEKIYYGYVPVGRFNVDLNRILNFNAVEGTRLGFGAHTNEKFSEKYTVGAFLGYGFRDQRMKYGADFSMQLLENKNVRYKTFFSYDLKEAGGTFFYFDKPQYSSEILRKYRLRILDLVSEFENSLTAHPLKNLDAVFAINLSHHTTTYSYNFKNIPTQNFDFTELRGGIRYAFGEQFIKILHDRQSIPTKYPVFYLQYSKGINAMLGNYNYTRLDFKVEQSIKILDMGTSTFQFTGGNIKGETPYSKLFNGRGSLKQPSVVIHNSFETMAYNEFLSDQFIALFYTHNFGRLYFRNKHIRPSLILLHNIGQGSLKNPLEHTGIAFKTLEKGYIESGLFADNIFVLNVAGLKTGIGAGGFIRYGAYALPKFGDNLVFKFSTNFFL